MVIYHELKGQIGNNIFQFYHGQYLAEKLKCKVIYFGKHEFLNQFFNIPSCYQLNVEEKLNRIDKIVPDYKQVGGIDWEDKIDYENTFFHHNDVVSGWFQSKQFFPQQYTKLTFKENVLCNTECIDLDKSVCMHLRFGDYLNTNSDMPWDFGWTLPLSYYVKALKYLSFYKDFDKVYVVSDNLILSKIILFPLTLNYKINFVSNNGPVQDMMFLSKFKNIIISASTFSWWAAEIGDAQHKVGPKNFLPITDKCLPPFIYYNCDFIYIAGFKFKLYDFTVLFLFKTIKYIKKYFTNRFYNFIKKLWA